MTQNQHPLLEIRDLRVSFETHRGIIPAVDGVSINIPRGQTVALVGESGCGKSTAALSILKLIPQPPGRFDGGQVLFCDQDTPPLTKGGRGGGEKHARASLGMPPGHTSSEKFPHPDGRGSDIQTGKTLAGKPPVAPEISVTPENPALVYPNHDREGVAKHGGAALSHGTQKNPPTDLLQLNEKEMQKIRGGKIAMIFQEPLTSLNPVFTVGEQIVEAIELHQPLRGTKAWNKAIEMLDRVGIDHPHQRAMDYPHQLSGGMQQRVMIAMALSCEPDLLIADEPTTALDVTIQAQILELLRSLQKERDMSLLLITHDLGVVAQMADVVYVMYAGKIVEHAPVVELFENPLHPYTQGLLRCTPQIKSSSEMKDHGHNEKLEVIPGKVPDLSALPSGCGFHPRCDLTRRKAAENTRLTISILTESDRPAFSSPTSQRTSTATNQSVVLKNCVESYDTEPSGIPLLHEVRPHHFVACWEI